MINFESFFPPAASTPWSTLKTWTRKQQMAWWVLTFHSPVFILYCTSTIWFNLKTCLLISTWSWRRRTMTGNQQNTSSLWVPRWLSWARRNAPTKLRWVILTLRSALQTCDGCVEERPQMDTCCYQAHQILMVLFDIFKNPSLLTDDNLLLMVCTRFIQLIMWHWNNTYAHMENMLCCSLQLGEKIYVSLKMKLH